MKHHRALSFAVFCLLATAAPRLARSQPSALSADAASAQADDLTHHGVELLKQHRWAEAEALFRQALALKRACNIVGNLGLAEAGLGKWRDATEHIAFALSTFPANGKAAHRDLLREKLATAREHVAGLTIEVDVTGAEVFVDRKSVGTAPLVGEVFVESGAHVVEARLAGREGARREVTVAAGGAANLKLALPETPTPPGSSEQTPDRPRPVVIGIGGALGVALAAAGVGLIGFASKKGSDADALLQQMKVAGVVCMSPPAPGQCQQLLSLRQDHDTFQNNGVPLLLVGGALGAATIAYALWPRSKTERAFVRALPIAGPGGGGLLVQGTF